jgi:hypothetical protein
MRARQNLLMTLVVGVCISAIAGGCQTDPRPDDPGPQDAGPQDAGPQDPPQTTVEEPITLLDRKPNVMLLVDRSGSMTSPVNESDPDCMVRWEGESVICGFSDATACNTAVCPTRWSELQAAVPGFLAESGAEARFGLTTFPDTRGETGVVAACRPATASSVLADLPRAEDDASLLAHANQVNEALQGIPNSGEGRPAGGSPASMSLRFVRDLPGLQARDRQQFVVLVTDGLPNCNEQNAHHGGEAALCRCTSVFCTGELERRGCLDQEASVEAVRELAARNVQTLVVGFGAEVARGDGPAVLEAMAQAGGFHRTCEGGQTSCGPGNPCDPLTRRCQRASFQADNQAGLSNVLGEIHRRLLQQDPCLLRVLPSQLPSDPALVVAYVDGQRTVAGGDTWTLVDGGVRFLGATCGRILAAPPGSPVRLELRAIRQR